MPRHARAEGLPANESVEHFVLKWAAHHVLTREMECPYVVVESGAGTRRAGRRRHDAVGLRFRAGRSPAPWVEVAAGAVVVQVLDEASGRWVAVPAADLAARGSDPTLRAFERGEEGALVPLRAVAPGRDGGIRVRRGGGRRRELAQLCGADAKRSAGDLRAGLRDAAARLRGLQYFVIVAPAGLARADDLPPKVGLAEVAMEHLVGEGGAPAIDMRRWPEALRPGAAWDDTRTEAFARRAYHSLNGLFARQLFWFLAQEALDRRVAAERAHSAAPLSVAAAEATGQTPAGAAAAGGRAPARALASDAHAESTAIGPPGSGKRATRRIGSAARPQGAPPAGEPSAFRLRTYAPSDRQAVVDLWERAGIGRPWLDLGRELEAWRDPELMLVAEAPHPGAVDGSGMSGGTAASSDGGWTVIGAVLGGWDGRRGWIHHLAVDPRFRRRGVATALMREAERRLRTAGAPKVNLLIRPDNFAVAALYAEMGYQVEEMRFMSRWLVPPPISDR